jgi:hypothetical protein
LNHWENVQVLPYALGDVETVLHFALPPNQHASGVGHVFVNKASATGNTIEVECRQLDSFADQIGPAKAIFCDAEGAETMILRGAQKYLASHKPMVVLEASPKLLRRAGSSLVELQNLLTSVCYRAFVVGRFGLRPVTTLSQASAGNWFCLHESRLDLVRKCSAAILRCGLLPCVRGLNPLSR